MASRQNTASSISAKTSSTSRWKASCPRREPGRPPGEPCIMASDDDDPRAPYKVYEGDELKGTYATRAEARRRQQQLESAQENRTERQPHCSIKDRNGDIAMWSPILITATSHWPTVRSSGVLGEDGFREVSPAFWAGRSPEIRF